MSRNDIMQDCPEEFEDRLKEIIDDIEDKVNKIKDKLDINKLSDLGDIEDAFDLASDLASELY